MRHTSANKKKLKLYALISMQTKNQNGKHETTLPPCLDKALFFKERKETKIREGGNKLEQSYQFRC